MGDSFNRGGSAEPVQLAPGVGKGLRRRHRPPDGFLLGQLGRSKRLSQLAPTALHHSGEEPGPGAVAFPRRFPGGATAEPLDRVDQPPASGARSCPRQAQFLRSDPPRGSRSLPGERRGKARTGSTAAAVTKLTKRTRSFFCSCRPQPVPLRDGSMTSSWPAASQASKPPSSSYRFL